MSIALDSTPPPAPFRGAELNLVGTHPLRTAQRFNCAPIYKHLTSNGVTSANFNFTARQEEGSLAADSPKNPQDNSKLFVALSGGYSAKAILTTLGIELCK